MSLFDTIETNVGAPDPGQVPPSMRRAAMLEHPTLAVAAIQKGRIRETNASWKSLFALPPDVSVESHVATLFPNVTSADRFERTLQGELAPARGGGATARSEHLLMRRDGSAFLAEVVVWLFSADDGDRPLGADAIWQIRDITVERTLRRELRDLEDYHRELSRHSWDMTFVIDRKGRISYASSSIEGALGYRVHAMLGEPFASLLEAEHAAEAEQWLRAASRRQAGGEAVQAGDTFPLRVMHSDGSVRVLACRPRDCFSIPRIAGMVIHARDVTDGASDDVNDGGRSDAQATTLRAALVELARLPGQAPAERLAALLASIRAHLDADVVTFWEAEDDGDARRWVPHAARGSSEGDAESAPLPLLGADGEDEMPLLIDDLRDAATRYPEATAALQASSLGALAEVAVVDGGVDLGRLAVATKDSRTWSGAEVDFLVGSAPLLALAVRGRSVSSVTEVGHAADALTGLPGRVAAARDLDDELAAVGAGDPPVVLVVGLDRLQDINDGLGLAAGDAVIARAAAVLTEVASDARVSRIGGDEFMVVVSGMESRLVDALVQTILQRIAESGGVGLEQVSVEASIGIARFAFDDADAATLIQQADLALREAKRRGGAQAFTYNPRLAAATRTQKELDGEIEGALARNEFTIFYQPQIGLASGDVVGFEALVRWQHPTRGLLLPDAFIGSAFKRGLIDALTKTVLTQVCEQIAAWRRSGNVPELPVAVNVSGRQFHDRRLPALVASALLKSGLPARLLVLEITEQSLIGNDAGIDRVVKELSRLGVRIAISDFNVGHASFKYLKQLSVSQIKLGSSFVKGLPEDPESVIFVAAFVDLARRLKYQVIAEGVETREQCEHLREIGCGVGQGFHLGAPLSAAEIETFVEAKKNPVH